MQGVVIQFKFEQPVTFDRRALAELAAATPPGTDVLALAVTYCQVEYIYRKEFPSGEQRAFVKLSAGTLTKGSLSMFTLRQVKRMLKDLTRLGWLETQSRRGAATKYRPVKWYLQRTSLVDNLNQSSTSIVPATGTSSVPVSAKVVPPAYQSAINNESSEIKKRRLDPKPEGSNEPEERSQRTDATRAERDRLIAEANQQAERAHRRRAGVGT